MAPSAHSIPSLLPWQDLPAINADVSRWQLEITTGGHAPRGLAMVLLYYRHSSRRYLWTIIPVDCFTKSWLSRGPGWRHYSAAEAAMLRRLSAILHPDPPLPASLPPRGTTIAPAIDGR